MKKLIFTALLFSVFTCKIFSQAATVTVFSQDGEKFWVILNGIKQNDSPNTNVKVTGLTSPNYRLKIIFEDEKIKAIDKDIMTRDVDNVLCDQAYVLKKDKKGRHVMRLNSFEPVKTIATTVEPNQVAVPIATEEKKPAATHQPTTSTTTTTTKAPKENSTVGVNVKDPVTGETISMNMNISETGVGVNVKAPDGENVNMNVGYNEGATTHTSVTTTTTTTTGHHVKTPEETHYAHGKQPTQPTYKLPGYNGPAGCEYPMADTDFNDAKKSISSKSFEDSKMTIAKQITSSNCLLTNQVKEIMMLFSFEDSKLTFAKYAYAYTFDIGNYYKVNDAFTFEMSIDELNEFISKQKR